jgi:hypothetical protein
VRRPNERRILGMSSKRAKVTCLAISISLLFVLGACGEWGNPAANCDRNKPQQETWQDPIYPGAQNVKVVTPPQGRYNTIFETNAKPEDVLTWYRDTLAKSGWEPELDDWRTPLPNTLDYKIPNCCKWGWLHVTVRPASSGTNTVEVEHGWGMGCG